jgi:protein gp37
MGAKTSIEWCDHTFNPWIGCTRVSEGCVHCYAEEMMDKRYGRVKWGPKGERSVTSDAYWRQPRIWNRAAQAAGVKRRVFCASLADVFDDHESISDVWRAGLWELIAETQNLEWLLLTKRPENWPKFMPVDECRPPFENVRLGVTIENQPAYNARFPYLQVARGLASWPTFISYEPALGPIDWENLRCGAADWLICGGESGKDARPMHPDWARAARDGCASASIPFLMKQWGEWGPDVGPGETADRIMDGRARCAWFDGSAWHYEKDGYAPSLEQTKGCGDWVYHLGKKANGALLDGRDHKEFPEALA